LIMPISLSRRAKNRMVRPLHDRQVSDSMSEMALG
jgi:hypothetical protein